MTDKIMEKFEQILATGKAQAVTTLDRLQRELPNDRLVNTGAIKFIPGPERWVTVKDEQVALPGSLEVQIPDTAQPFKLHPHALGQLISKTGLIGANTVTNLLEHGRKWSSDLAADIMTTTYHNTERERLLFREVQGTVRGALSDKYRRMNSGPIFESFISATSALGAVPTDSRHLDTKIALTMSLPEIFDPVPSDPLGKLLFGCTLSNSDYGDGALSLKLAFLRIFCTNLGMRQEVMRKVHLGARLSDATIYSEATIQLDTRTQGSMISDLVNGLLNPARIHAEIDTIKQAAGQEINVKNLLAALQKKGTLTKTEMAGISETFNSPDVELLPPGNTLWRASNAISLFAQTENLASRRVLELQQIAGDVLGKAA
jgi:hypothetical protein